MSVAHDPRKTEKHLYAPGPRPSLVEVHELPFFMVDGSGDPNGSEAYAGAVEALFSVAYAVRFALKREAGVDHPVMPLEGLWWMEGDVPFDGAKRDLWRWTLMIRQADEATAEHLAGGIATTRAKRAMPALGALRLETFHEGPAAQILHVGPYSEERATIDRLHAFIATEGLTPRGRHHEIYLNDPRRTAPERLRTIIRHPVS